MWWEFQRRGIRVDALLLLEQLPPKEQSGQFSNFSFCIGSSTLYFTTFPSGRLRLIVEFLLSRPSTVVRVIKPKSPTVREWNPPNWGTSQQLIRRQHWRAGNQSGVCTCWLFFSLLFPHSPLLSYPCADGTLWLNVRMFLHPPHPHTPNPHLPTFVLVRQKNCGWLLEETLWRLLFIGKGQSHICIWSLWGTEVQRENEKMLEGYSPFLK